jgi:hypothetical protein
MSRFGSWLRRSLRPERALIPARLDLCHGCGKAFVHPVTWSEWGPDAWLVFLRCGGCGRSRDVVATNAEVALFDRTLDRDMERMADEADRLEYECFAAEADNFGAALRMDLLSADDFR